MCRIQTDVFYLQIRIGFSEFGECNDAGNTVVPLCVKEADVQWQVGLIPFVVAGEHVKGVPIKISVKVTVPAP